MPCVPEKITDFASLIPGKTDRLGATGDTQDRLRVRIFVAEEPTGKTTQHVWKSGQSEGSCAACISALLCRSPTFSQ